MLAECKTMTVWLQSVMLKLQEYTKGQNRTEQNRCNCDIPLFKSIPQEFVVFEWLVSTLSTQDAFPDPAKVGQGSRGSIVSALEGGVNDLQLSSSCLSHGSEQKPSANGLEP